MGVMDLRRRIMLNEPHIVTPASAGFQTFQTDMGAPLKECKVHFAPVQDGTGDPSPDNVRAINGWTGCEVYSAGKNLLALNAQTPSVTINTGYDNTRKRNLVPGTIYQSVSSNNYWPGSNRIFVSNVGKGTITFQSNESSYGNGLCIKVKPGALYRVSFEQNSAVRMRYTFYDKDGTYINGGIFNSAVTASSNAEYMLVIFAPAANSAYYNVPITVTNVQLEVGSTATAYEPYQDTTLPIDWTDEAGTVYGGYVDLVRGEVWAEQKCVNLLATGKSGTWDSATVKGAFWYTAGIQQLKSRNDGVISEKLKVQNNVSLADTGNCIAWFVNGIIRWIELGTMEMTLSEYRAYLTENPLRVTYRLLEPELVTTITTAKLKTLKGTNNLWSNANGDIDLSYWAH